MDVIEETEKPKGSHVTSGVNMKVKIKKRQENIPFNIKVETAEE